VQTTSLDSNTTTQPTHDCTNVADLREQDFMFAFNGNYTQPDPYANCDGPPITSCDGTPTYIDANRCPAGAIVLGNVQPWRPNLGLWADGLYVIPPNNWIKWRYVTKDLKFTLIRDAFRSSYPPRSGAPAQDWGFVPTQCISYWPGHIEGPRN
jgi:hypothetical protein